MSNEVHVGTVICLILRYFLTTFMSKTGIHDNIMKVFEIRKWITIWYYFIAIVMLLHLGGVQETFLLTTPAVPATPSRRISEHNIFENKKRNSFNVLPHNALPPFLTSLRSVQPFGHENVINRRRDRQGERDTFVFIVLV